MKKSVLFVIFVLALSCLSAQWSSDPLVNNAICDLDGEQAIPKVVNGPTGDTYIGYFSNDSGNYDVRLQRLDSEGNELWAHDGILIRDNPAMTWLTDWDMTVDGENHAILTFQDIRNGGNNNIYAYRISPDGTFVWGADGLELTNSPAMCVSPKVEVTSSGNIVVAWQAETVSTMQKISPDGNLLWGTTGIDITSTNSTTWPQPFAVENDAILMKYFDDSGVPYAPTRHCFMQKYDTDGNAVWTNPTVITNIPGISAWTQIFNIISDDNNGCFISWHDSRGGGTISYPFTQHVNSDGSVGFVANGLQLSSETNRQNFYPEAVYNSGSGELTVYWHQTDGDQNNYGITGQKVDVNGAALWGNTGLNVIPISSLYVLLFAVRQANDDTIILYEKYLDTMNSYVEAMRLDSDGNFVWPGDTVTMCSLSSSKVHSEASQFAQNQIIAAWEDDRNGAKDIFAQNINLDGTLGAGGILNGTIEGTVVLVGGIGDITEVEVTAGDVTVNPDSNGDYSLSVPAGTYDVTASLEYYTPQTSASVEVTAGTVISGIDFTLSWIPVYNPPQNITVDPYTGAISWDPPEPYPGAVLQGYNLYFDGAFIAFINDLYYTISDLINGQIYTIGLSAVYDAPAESEIVEIQFIYLGTGAGNNLLAVTKLHGNYPNPFNPTTTISFSLKEAGFVSLEIYNVKGEKINLLVNDQLSAGKHSVVWNGTDNSGKHVSSGIYFSKMRSGNFTSTRKMILMK